MSVQWLTNCAWEDSETGALHIHVPRLLDELGVPDTPENREAATKMAHDVLVKLLNKTHAVIQISE